MGYQRLLVLATLFAVAAFLTLVIRIAHPHHRQLALFLYGIGWIPFLLSIRQFWSTVDGSHSPLLRWKIHFLVGLGFVLSAWALKVLLPIEKSPLLEVPLAELPKNLAADLQQLALIDEKMQTATRELQDSPFVTAEQMTTEQSRQLQNQWASFLEASFELDLLKSRYRAFYQINGFTHPRLHAQAFLVGYGAFVSQYRAAALVTAHVGRYETAKKTLDDARSDAGLPAGSFAKIQLMVSHPDEILRLNAGRAYLQIMKRRVDKHDAHVLRIEDQLTEITRLALTNTHSFVKNPLDFFEHEASIAWYPVQKGVALSMASVRTVSREYCITAADLAGEQANLQPGDILLTRREWHLTNLGIPGYWTHAALHIGSVEQMDQYFAGIAELDGKLPSQLISERFPDVYAAMTQEDPTGSFPCVIEALRPGVIVQSLQRSATADSLAVLRPRVGKADRWQAIASALPHYGKPYNYQFDFRTESALVCSQLVCKAYESIAGLRLDPAMNSGRLLFSPNEIAIKFDREWGTETSELDLVLFLDGSDIGKVTKRSAEDFRTSWSRPKWHIVFQ